MTQRKAMIESDTTLSVRRQCQLLSVNRNRLTPPPGKFKGQTNKNTTGAIHCRSARANPYHGAWTDSFIGTLNNEMLQGGCFIHEGDARTELFAYIGAYYNTHRRHSSLNYQTPTTFEAQFNSPK